MAATGNKVALTDQPAPENTGVEFSCAPLAEFRAALGLYALWTTLAWLSIVAGQTTLAPQAAGVLLLGIVATNALFVMISKSSAMHRPPDVTIALSQCVLGLTWATLFSFMSVGPGELVFGMYVSAILFAAARVRVGALSQLAAFATVSFAIVTIGKALLTTPQQPLWPEVVTIMTFAGIMGWLVLYGRHLHATGQRPTTHRPQYLPDHDRASTTAARASLTHTLNRSYILDSLAREKGRTDRSNNPLSICIFDIDNLERLGHEHGSAVAGLVLQRFGKRIRGELRAMDGVNAGGEQRTFDRVGGDRYIVLLPQTNLAGAARCAERIRGAIAKYPIDGQYAITLSGGIVEYQRGETVKALLDRAEAVLSRALAAGGNRIAGHAAADEHRANVIPLRGIKN